MTENRFPIEEGKEVGDVLLDVLLENNVISESVFDKINSAVILTEAVKTASTWVYHGRSIPWDVFNLVYTDYDKYETMEDVFKALGFDSATFGDDPRKRNDNMRKQMSNVVQHFNKAGFGPLRNFSERKNYYSERLRKKQELEQDKPTLDNIDVGNKNKKDKTVNIVNRINAQQLVSGEFYSNYTRIPKSYWGSWLRFWQREYSSVQNDLRLFGRSWRKTFILGYQITDSLLYEVWYNSIDSTFSIHDQRGASVTRKYPTLNEAIKGLVQFVTQASTDDPAIFASGGRSNQIALSLARSLSIATDSRVTDLMKIDNAEQAQQIKKAEQEKSEKESAERERRKIERENRRAAKAKNSTPGDDVSDIPPDDDAGGKEAFNKEMGNLRDAVDKTKKSREEAVKKAKKEAKLSENIVNEANFGELDDLSRGMIDMTDSRSYDSEVKRIREQADKSIYTQAAIKTYINDDLITTYNETKVRNNFSSRFLDKFINSGRSSPIVLPTDRPGFFDRIRMAFKGQTYRADFISGFSLSGAVNIEIWYITEPNPASKFMNRRLSDEGGGLRDLNTISSFYVFDVTSGKLLKKYIPYYRNAMTVVLAKIGTV